MKHCRLYGSDVTENRCGDSKKVDNTDPNNEVLFDRAVSSGRQHSRLGDLSNVIIHQCDVRGLEGGLGSSNTHGDSNVGLH